MTSTITCLCGTTIPSAFVSACDEPALTYKSKSVEGHDYYYQRGRFFCSRDCMDKAYPVDRNAPITSTPTFVLGKDNLRYKQHRDKHLWQRAKTLRNQGYYER